MDACWGYQSGSPLTLVRDTFSFIGIVERYDESLVLLASMLRIPLTEVLYLKAKDSTADVRCMLDACPVLVNVCTRPVSAFLTVHHVVCCRDCGSAGIQMTDESRAVLRLDTPITPRTCTV